MTSDMTLHGVELDNASLIHFTFIFFDAGYSHLCMIPLSISQASYIVWDGLGCRNLRRHSQLQTWWTHIFFFIALQLSTVSFCRINLAACILLLSIACDLLTTEQWEHLSS